MLVRKGSTRESQMFARSADTVLITILVYHDYQVARTGEPAYPRSQPKRVPLAFHLSTLPKLRNETPVELRNMNTTWAEITSAHTQRR